MLSTVVTLLALVAATRAVASATYLLSAQYSGATFLDNFDFFTASDPTHGFVQYVSASFAATWGLTRLQPDGSVYIGVDYMNVLNPSGGVGRDSVRITSKQAWGTGSLVVVDLAHVPGGQCGTWPAMWMLGPNWPYGGEIDIIEGVNSNQYNTMSLHTSPGCAVNSGSYQLGTQQTTNCDSSVNSNSGCGVTSPSSTTYGTGLNSIGGGIYATQITPTSISIWFFPRNAIPPNLQDPTTWGEPQANFQGCDVQSHFSNLQLVFDNTFCGDWAGNVWPYDATCAPKDANGCVDFVAKNPGAYVDSYWAINYVKVYTLGVATATSTSTSKSTTTSTATSKTSTSSSVLTSSSKKSTSTSTSTPTKTTSSSTSSSTKQTSTTSKKTTTTTSSSSSAKSTSSSKTSSSSSLSSIPPSSTSSSKKHQHVKATSKTTSTTSSKVTALARRSISTSSHQSPTTASTPENQNPIPDPDPFIPSSLDTFTLLGCYSPFPFSTTTSLTSTTTTNFTSPQMSLSTCLHSCTHYALAAVWNDTCVCYGGLPSPSSSPSTLPFPPNGSPFLPQQSQSQRESQIQLEVEWKEQEAGACNLPCPGDEAEFCGGGGGDGGGAERRGNGNGEGEKEGEEENGRWAAYRNLRVLDGDQYLLLNNNENETRNGTGSGNASTTNPVFQSAATSRRALTWMSVFCGLVAGGFLRFWVS